MLLHVSICGREPDTEGDYLPYSAPGDGTDVETASRDNRWVELDIFGISVKFSSWQTPENVSNSSEQSAAGTECGRRLWTQQCPHKYSELLNFNETGVGVQVLD